MFYVLSLFGEMIQFDLRIFFNKIPPPKRFDRSCRTPIICFVYVLFVADKCHCSHGCASGGVERYGFDSWPNMKNLDKRCAIF